MSLQIGQIVRFREARSNGGQLSPAVVTRVWSENLFNVKVLPDGRTPYDATSVSVGNNGFYIEE